MSPVPDADVRAGGSLYALLVDRPVATIMAFLAAVVFGAVSYTNLPLNLMPDLDYPTLTVRTEFEGAAPGEVETQVSRPLEEALSTVPGLVTLESISRAGVSDVILEFEWNSDMADLAQAVRERLGLLELPDEAKRPLVLRYDPNLDPILRLSLAGGSSEEDLIRLRRIADDEVRRAIETLPGVAAVKVRGGLEREVAVEVHEGLLHARGFTLDDVIARLGQENINLAGGSLMEGQTEYLIRTLNEFRGPDDIRELVLFNSSGGFARVGDFATVAVRAKERDVVGRAQGQEAVEIAVYREADANIVAVSRAVRAAVFGTAAQQAFVAAKKAEAEKKKAEEASPSEGGAAKGEAKTKKKGKDGAKARKGKGGKKGAKAGKGKKGKGKGRGGRGGGARMMERAMTAFLAHELPDDLTIAPVSDQARFIEAAIASVLSAAWFGALLAVLVLYVFLRHVWSTVVIASAIPISVVCTFAPMYLFDVSLNLMSLGGLALAIGMLVDNSIVVLESVHRCREDGDGPFEAAVRGTSEVAGAVFASTLTTVAVFFPIAFVTGVAGQLFGDLALTVVFGLLASLVVALFLIPVLAALPERMRRPDESAVPRIQVGAVPRETRDALAALPDFVRAGGAVSRLPRLLLAFLAVPVLLLRGLIAGSFLAVLALLFGVAGGVLTILDRVLRFVLRPFGRAVTGAGDLFGRGFSALETAYERALGAVLRRATVVLVVAVVLLAGALHLGRGLGSELIPEVKQGTVLAHISLPVGTPLPRTLEVTGAIEERIRKLPNVQTVFTAAGVEATAGAATDRGENTADLTVQLADGVDLDVGERAVRAGIREIVGSVPSVTVELSAPTLFSFRTPLEVEVRGRDLDDLRAAADAAVARLSQVPGLRDVRSNLQAGYPEVRIRYRRDKLARYELDLGTVARAVRDKVAGNVATDLRGYGKRTDVRVVLREADRGSVDDLRRLNVNPRGTPPIPLASVADLVSAEGPSEIRRSDQSRAALVSAELEGFDLGSAAIAVDQALAELDLPDGVAFEVGGQSQEMEASAASLRFALLLAIFLVYVIMASQFESVSQPLVILLALPLALVGVVPTLAAVNLPVSVVVLIGAIVLSGVVVNNAIVLIDYANHLRTRGTGLDDAIRTASRVRLRPILISTLTTVLGLLPMVLSGGEGSEIRKPLAITVIAGLSASTLLTLGVIPVFYRAVSALRRDA